MVRILLKQCGRDIKEHRYLKGMFELQNVEDLLGLCPLFLTMLALSLAKVKAQSGKQEEIQSPRAECVLGNISLEHAVSQPRRIELTINTCTENLQKELQVCKGPQVLEAKYHGLWSGPQSGWGREQDTTACIYWAFQTCS